jgi:hypothetical protein
MSFNKPRGGAEIDSASESPDAIIVEAMKANARAATSAAQSRAREGQNPQAAAMFAGAVRDLADALNSLAAPPAATGSGVAEPSKKSREPWAQRARAYAERTLEG